VILDGVPRDQFGRRHEADALIERDETAGDGGGAGAAIRLDDIAVDDDLPLAEMSNAVIARSERPTSRWISWVRPLCLPAAASRPRAFGVSRVAACRIRR
jgi:hypothetical protein